MAEYEIPNELLYTREDEWVRTEDENVVIGITDYAQQQLGDIVFFELPEIGARIAQGEPFGVIESVKAVSDLYAPITGEVVSLNKELDGRPEAANEDCYGDGWLIAIAWSDEEEFDSLLDAKAYRAHVDERAD